MHGDPAHISADKGTGIIRAVKTTPGNEADVSVAPSLIPDRPGEVYADRAYDALAVEKAIEAKGGISKLMRKGHRWLPAKMLETHNRPLRPIRARIEKIFGTWKRTYRFRHMRWMGLGQTPSPSRGDRLQFETLLAAAELLRGRKIASRALPQRMSTAPQPVLVNPKLLTLPP